MVVDMVANIVFVLMPKCGKDATRRHAANYSPCANELWEQCATIVVGWWRTAKWR